jgi:4-hydroxy-tetrahydrodipicolinate synthase
MFSRHANSVGADAVIAMAPYIQAMMDEDAIVDYYRGISDVVDVSVFIQNHTRGSVLSPKLMARIVQEAEHVEYIKEETFPVTHMVTQAIELCGPKLKGVFGGAGGRYMLLEHPRGVAGQMPGCHLTDIMVRFWDTLDGGDVDEARRIYGLMAQMYALETVKGSSYPEVLRRRGVIDAVYSRSATSSRMDEWDHHALDDILRQLEPLMTWHEGGPIRYSDAGSAGGDAPPPALSSSGDSSGVATFDQVG